MPHNRATLATRFVRLRMVGSLHLSQFGYRVVGSLWGIIGLSFRRIALPELLAVTGRRPEELWNLRARGLFPFAPDRDHAIGRRGSASYFPQEAVDYLRRLDEMGGQSGRVRDDERLWLMWLDTAAAAPGWPINMRAWVLTRLDRMIDATMRAKAAGATIKPGAERELLGSLAGRVRNPRGRRAALDWLVAWALNFERPDLYSATPEGVAERSFFDLLLKLAGPLFENMSVPRVRGRRENLSARGGPYLLARFRRIVALAPERYIEQARHDWRAIVKLIGAAKRVDWNKAPALAPIGAKPEPPSWAARKARRTRRKPPPDFIRIVIEEWHRDLECRALLFSALLVARRLIALSSMSEVPDILLSIAQQWLEGLPQIDATGDTTLLA